MQISRVNNYNIVQNSQQSKQSKNQNNLNNNNVAFGAKIERSSLENMLRNLYNDRSNNVYDLLYPQIYTMIKHLETNYPKELLIFDEKLAYKRPDLVFTKPVYCIKSILGNCVSSSDVGYFDALKNCTVSCSDKLHSQLMPKSVFEMLVYQNRNKTKEDILELGFDSKILDQYL